MFKEERKQYAEDRKNHGRPWELWECSGMTFYWEPLDTHPMWIQGIKYRRKQTAFVPEYYSGLNYREAKHLIGKTVEYTNNADSGWYVGTLKQVSKNEVIAHFGVLSDGGFDFFVYIRTCEETFKHQTINIGGVELPKPETVAPTHGTVYWMFGFGAPVTAQSGSLYDMGVWPKDISKVEKEALKNGAIHITEDRAKAWADWWKTAVIDKMG